MSKKLGLPSIIVTLCLIAASIYLVYNNMVLHTDYGEYSELILLLSIAVLVFTLVLVMGCITVIFGLGEEELESMAPKIP